jgi:hypothetical protein
VAFNITTRLETSICFFEELVPVDDAADQPTKVDVVLRVGSERPLLSAVFNIATEVLDSLMGVSRLLTIAG